MAKTVSRSVMGPMFGKTFSLLFLVHMCRYVLILLKSAKPFNHMQRAHTSLIRIEHHEISNNVACATSKSSASAYAHSDQSIC